MFKKEYTTKDVPYVPCYISAFALYIVYGIKYGINDYNTKFRIQYTLEGKSYVIINNMRLYI